MPSPTISPSSNGNGPKRSRLPVYSPTANSTTNLKRANDELRQHISRLKSELEIEKAKSKQVHRDKVADIKRLKDQYDKEKALVAGSFSHKQKIEHEHEIKKLKESLLKEKEIEIKHIIKFKDEELKTTKKMMLEDKEFSLRQLEEKLRKELSSKTKDVNDNDFKLKQEIIDFKKQKQQFEELYKQKSASEAEKVELIRKLKEEHDKETQRVIRDARIQIARNVHELKAAQKALSEKEQEITRRELEVTKLEEEKEILSDKLRTEPKRIGEQFDRSEKERELQMKNVELRKSLDEMTKRTGILEKDNLLKRSESKDSDQTSRAEQRVKELKKRNGELVTLAKKLEEKAKRLQDELKDIKSKGTATKNLSPESPAAFDSFKKSFTLQRARDLAENAKSTIAKDKEISQLKEKIVNLEKQNSKIDDSLHIRQLKSTMQQLEKEKLKLEKQIANKARESLNLRVNSQEESNLRKKLEIKSQEGDNLRKELEFKSKEEANLRSELELKGKEEDNLRYELESKGKAKDNLRIELESAEKEKDRLNRLLHQQKIENGELQTMADKEKHENNELKSQIEQLRVKSENFDHLVEQLKERDEECMALAQDLRSTEKEIQKLKDVLTDTERINRKLESEQEKSKQVAKSLQSKMADMSKKLVEMQSFELECKMLKDRLQDSETKYMMMEGQLESLQDKVTEFEKLEKDLEESAEKCKKWERDYDYAVDQINKKNKEISELNDVKEEAKTSHEIEIADLQNEISRLESICEDFEHKETGYKAALSTAKEQMTIEVLKNDVYVQTSRPHTPVQAQRTVTVEEVVPSFEHALEASRNFEKKTNKIEQIIQHEDEDVTENFEADPSSKFDDDILDIASLRIAELAVNSSSEGELSREDDPHPKLSSLDHKGMKEPPVGRFKADDKDTKKVEDHRLVDLHRQNSDTSDELTLSLDEMESDEENFDIPRENNNRQRPSLDGPIADSLIANGQLNKPPATKRLEYQKKTNSNDSLFGPITPHSSVDEFVSGKNLRNQHYDSENSMRKNENTSAFITPSTNADHLTVFIAKYTYDPFKHSPNEDPSLELSLHAGDFVYVFGDVDEDGFFTGELVDGQRGLVPSNFVEKVSDETELFAPLTNGHGGYPGDESDDDLTEVSGSISPSDSLLNLQRFQPTENDKPLDAEYLKNTKAPSFTNSNNIDDALREELSSLNSETDEDNDYMGDLPPPRQLTLERQLNSSVVLSWLPPECVSENEIHGYAVKADGVLKQILIGASRTKAIVSDIQRDKVYRMSVHTINKQEKESPNSVATITVGRGASAIPSDVLICNLSPRSAELEWKCGNSSYAHAISLSGKTIHLVKPGIDRFRLTNLDPDTEYEVAIEARKAKDIHKKPNAVVCVSDGLIFRTPKEGVPEPPLNVQVQINNSKLRLETETSLLVSWLPVTITDIGTSNGSIVQGYKIYMNYKEVSQTDSPTTDHVIISSHVLRHFRHEFTSKSMKIWVTSQSSVGESSLSNIVVLDEDTVNEIMSLAHDENTVVAALDVAEEKERTIGLSEDTHTFTADEVSAFDLHRKNSEVNRKIEWINELVDEKPMEAVICEQDERAPATDKVLEPKASLEIHIDNETTNIGKEAESNQNEAINAQNEASVGSEVPIQRVKGKSTVIMYDVTDSDSSIENEDTDSDDEIQHGFKGEEHMVVGQEPDNSEAHNNAVKAVEDDTASCEASDSQTGPSETLILPTIPPPDYDDDAEEVKPTVRISFDDLLLSDDSELSAIEEETDEELLEYNNVKDRSISPGNTFSLDNDPDNDPERKDHLDNVNIENDKTNENITFSIHSDDVQGETFDIEKETESSDKKNVIRSSKDSLTFSSDDVVDMLDKDVIGTVPDLPVDEYKDSRLINVNDSGISERQVGDSRAAGSNKMNPDDKMVTGSSIKQTDDKRVSETEERPVHSGVVNSYREHNMAAKEQVPKTIEKSKVPAIRAPAQSNDHGSVNKDVCTPGQLTLKDKESFVCIKTGNIGEAKLVNKQELEFANAAEDNVATFEASSSEDGLRAGNPELKPNLKQENSGKINNENKISQSRDNGILIDSMGQAIEPQLDDVGYDDDYGSDTGSIKMPNPSVHDLYNLHAGGSFDESILDSEPGYEPDFGGEEPRHNQTGDNDLINEKLNTDSNEGPVVESTELNVSINADGQNNAGVHMNENSNENTRINHVVDESDNDNMRVFIALFSYDPITMSPNPDGVDEELAFVEGDLIKIFGDVDEDGFYYGELNDKRGFVPSNMVQEVSLGNLNQSINIPPPPSQEDSSLESTSEGKQTTSSLQKQSSFSTNSQNTTANSGSIRTREPEKELTNHNRASGSLGTMNNTQRRDSKVNNIANDLDNIVIEEDDKNYRYISERDSLYCLPPRRMIALYDYDPAISSPNVDSEVELAFTKGEILFVFGDMDEDGFFAAQNENERGLVPSNFLEECPVSHEPEEIEINMGAESPSIKSSSRKSSTSSIGAASPVDSGKKKKKGILAKGKKIFSKLKGK